MCKKLTQRIFRKPINSQDNHVNDKNLSLNFYQFFCQSGLSQLSQSFGQSGFMTGCGGVTNCSSNSLVGSSPNSGSSNHQMMTSPNSYSGQGHSSSHHSQQQQQQQQQHQHQYQLSWDREVHSMIETVAKGEKILQ